MAGTDAVTAGLTRWRRVKTAAVASSESPGVDGTVRGGGELRELASRLPVMRNRS